MRGRYSEAELISRCQQSNENNKLWLSAMSQVVTLGSECSPALCTCWPHPVPHCAVPMWKLGPALNIFTSLQYSISCGFISLFLSAPLKCIHCRLQCEAMARCYRHLFACTVSYKPHLRCFRIYCSTISGFIEDKLVQTCKPLDEIHLTSPASLDWLTLTRTRYLWLNSSLARLLLAHFQPDLKEQIVMLEIARTHTVETQTHTLLSSLQNHISQMEKLNLCLSDMKWSVRLRPSHTTHYNTEED